MNYTRAQVVAMSEPAFEEVKEIADRVEGLLGSREGGYLFALSRVGSKMGAVVEIGSWKGKSTVWIAKGSEAVGGAKVYAIDPHFEGTEREFAENIRRAGVGSHVVPIVKTSEAAVADWKLPIGFLWIDGSHTYEIVRKDFLGFAPYVVPGGVIAMHDTYSHEGVRKFVEEEVLTSDRFRVIGQFDSILAVRKVERLSLGARLKRRAVILLRRLWKKARAERRHWRTLPRWILRALALPKI